MTHDELLSLLRAHLDDIVPGQGAALGEDDDFRDELDLDSMDFLKLVRGLHETLNVDVPETDYAKLRTLRAFADYLAART